MLVYEYVCFRCMIEDKCICVCLIPSLFSFDYDHGAISPVVLMRSSRSLHRLREWDVTVLHPMLIMSLLVLSIGSVQYNEPVGKCDECAQ